MWIGAVEDLLELLHVAGKVGGKVGVRVQCGQRQYVAPGAIRQPTRSRVRQLPRFLGPTGQQEAPLVLFRHSRS